jgi:hypothetical protein
MLPNDQPLPGEELDFLRSQAARLERDMSAIQKRIKLLESQKEE